jgi:ubiquinone/menaquinone biosynthesis C-methylase UbiE
MPTSSPDPITYVCKKIVEVKPNTVLDVGVGFGKYGFLAREYTDIWNDRYFREEWKCTIIGVEIFAPYIQNHHRHIYDSIVVYDAYDYLQMLCPDFAFDLIICSDMLEHLPKEKGLKVLEQFKRVGKTSIVIVPVDVRPQGPVHGNKYERHVSSWSKEELEQFGNVTVFNEKVFILEIV